jgi:hypothetical protein
MASVYQLIGRQIQAPDLIRCGRLAAVAMIRGRASGAPRLVAERQSFLSIQSTYQLITHLIAFALLIEKYKFFQRRVEHFL